MNYTLRKILLVVILVPLACVGGLLVLAAGLRPWIRGENVNGFMLIFGAMLLGISTFNLVTWFRRLTNLQARTYNWYRSKYPAHMHGSKASCYSCKSDRVTIRSLLQHTYHRAHVCSDCGTTLYYSPEQS